MKGDRSVLIEEKRIQKEPVSDLMTVVDNDVLHRARG